MGFDEKFSTAADSLISKNPRGTREGKRRKSRFRNQRHRRRLRRQQRRRHRIRSKEQLNTELDRMEARIGRVEERLPKAATVSTIQGDSGGLGVVLGLLGFEMFH